MVTIANDNATYHLAEQDGTRLTIPIAGKRVNIFKKRHDEGPDLEDFDEDDEGNELPKENGGDEEVEEDE